MCFEPEDRKDFAWGCKGVDDGKVGVLAAVVDSFGLERTVVAASLRFLTSSESFRVPLLAFADQLLHRPR